MIQKVYYKRDRRTVYQYERFYSAHLKNNYADVKISQFKSVDFDQIITQLLKRGFKERSVNNVITFIKQLFKFAIDEEMLVINPVKKVQFVQVPEREIRYLREEEISILLRYHRFEKIYPVLVLVLNTGMRLGEIFGLCWDCISFETNQILVKRTLDRKLLKEKTKTKLIRAIPMNDPVIEIMKNLIKNQTSSQFVFADENGSSINPDHYSNRVFHQALVQAGLNRIRFHDLRHTYASQYMMKGGNLFDLQKILGHTDIKTTQIYAHLSPAHLKNAVKIINFSCDDLIQKSDGTLLAHSEK